MYKGCIKEGYVRIKVTFQTNDYAFETLHEDLDSFYPYVIRSCESNDEQEVYYGFMKEEKFYRIMSMMDCSPYGNGYSVYLYDNWEYIKNPWMKVR
jgi:hypothetical protein